MQNQNYYSGSIKRATHSLVFSAVLLLLGCSASSADESITTPSAPGANEAVAIFAGGCFWCMEAPYDKLPGVLSTTSGYTDGETKDPTYREVSAGVTGHTEAVEIRYDPAQVSYAKLLEVFWRNIDPFAVDRQFCDSGTQYRSGIYYSNEQERELARASADAVAEKFGETVATEIKPASTFYAAEDYHQDYYQKNPVRYKFYRRGCGRDKRLAALWSG